MIKQLKPNQSQWVFSIKEDLWLFAGSSAIALFASLFFESFTTYFWMFILFDQPHVFTTYFYTYTSDRFNKKFRIPLIILPILCFILSYLMFVNLGDKFAYAVLSNFSAFHFAKQQSAWFYITKGKEKSLIQKRKIEHYIDKAVIQLSVLGPLLITMTDSIGRSGWRESGDLIPIPLFVKNPIFVLMIISWILYIALQIYKYQKFKVITWGKNFHLINALLIWTLYRFATSGHLAMAGQLIVVFGHSFPYIYLGLKYYESRKNKETFWPGINNMKLMATCVVLLGILISYIEVISEKAFYSDGIVPSIWLGIIFSHFLIDTFMWKTDTHKEGLEFLRKKIVNE